MLGCCGEDDLLRVAVEIDILAGRNCGKVIDIRPDLRVQATLPFGLRPVGYDPRAAEVDEKTGVRGMLEETGDEGAEAGLVVAIAAICAPSTINHMFDSLSLGCFIGGLTNNHIRLRSCLRQDLGAIVVAFHDADVGVEGLEVGGLVAQERGHGVLWVVLDEGVEDGAADVACASGSKGSVVSR